MNKKSLIIKTLITLLLMFSFICVFDDPADARKKFKGKKHKKARKIAGGAPEPAGIALISAGAGALIYKRQNDKKKKDTKK
ncbi:MAG: PEP-CTERM sorting domain-containing protein [Nitrospira sp.]|nr:PEP-CTERM sorting domain-containing protein [bacterium]MBL7049575.1 PEP-CTERM sorting domain-containing protein [Nitrospira sp.]